MGTKVRILTAITQDGITYQPDQVVEFQQTTAKALSSSGAVDTHRDAVGYCIKTLGVEVVMHPVSEDQADAADTEIDSAKDKEENQ